MSRRAGEQGSKSELGSRREQRVDAGGEGTDCWDGSAGLVEGGGGSVGAVEQVSGGSRRELEVER